MVAASRKRMLRKLFIPLVLAAAFSCSRPSSYEPFQNRENAEYGDTYSFMLDMSDEDVRYSLEFYTRVERRPFSEFPGDSIVLDLRMISPSDSILVDTTLIRFEHIVDSAYYTKDFISPYKDDFRLPESGEWRLKAKVVNDSPCLRGLGIIFRRY